MDVPELFTAYAGCVATIGLRLLGDRDEAQELVQEVFLEAHRGLGQLREPGAVRGWLTTVAVRAARRRLLGRRRRQFFGFGSEVDFTEVAGPSATPEQRALLTAIYRRLEQLSVDERMAWTLRFVEGERLEQVASLCGCSLATAKRRIARAKAFLDEELAR